MPLGFFSKCIRSFKSILLDSFDFAFFLFEKKLLPYSIGAIYRTKNDDSDYKVTFIFIAGYILAYAYDVIEYRSSICTRSPIE